MSKRGERDWEQLLGDTRSGISKLYPDGGDNETVARLNETERVWRDAQTNLRAAVEAMSTLYRPVDPEAGDAGSDAWHTLVGWLPTLVLSDSVWEDMRSPAVVIEQIDLALKPWSESVPAVMQELQTVRAHMELLRLAYAAHEEACSMLGAVVDDIAREVSLVEQAEALRTLARLAEQ